MTRILNVVFTTPDARAGGTPLGPAFIIERGKPVIQGRIEEVPPERMAELTARPGVRKVIVQTNRGVAWRFENDPATLPPGT